MVGVVGYNDSSVEIDSCFNKGIVESIGQNEYGNSNVGGIIALNIATVSSCYNAGTIKGAYSNVGGIAGLNRGILENSYNIGNISGPLDTTGAIVGNNDEFYYAMVTYVGKINNCYSLEGVATNLYGVNEATMGSECSFKTSDELKGLSNVLGNKFKEDAEGINDGYPILYWQ